jgi:hypothetical protein
MKELIEYLERKIELCIEMNMPLEKFAYTDALKKARALQLQQTGVKQSVCNYCLEWVDELPDNFGCKECIEKHK